MNVPFMIAQFLGGLGLFFYAVNILSDSLQKLASNKIRNILESLTKTTWLATLFGIVMTLALQSSASSTVMVVEFVNAGLMTLSQGLSVSLGSALGTYILIQLISLPLFTIALWMIFCGFVLFLMKNRTKLRIIGQGLISFGCMFVGMTFMSNAFSPLRNMSEVYTLLHQLGAVPILGILAGCILTTLMQSSSVFLAIMISLSINGLLPVNSIISLVMGAHIGGTFTTLISSFSAEKIDAKRVAIANSLYRVIVTIIMFPFFSQFAELVKWFSPDLARQVVNAYFFSTVFMVMIFLPVNKLLAQALVKYIKARNNLNESLKFKYIVKGAREVPTIALNQANREVHWMGQEILECMYEIIPRLIFSQNANWIMSFEETEKRIDWHYLEISKFLSELYNQDLTKEQIIQTQSIQLIAKEWEHIADRHIIAARLIGKMDLKHISLAEEDLESIDDLFMAIAKKYLKLLETFDRRNNKLIQEITADEEGTHLHNDLRVKIISDSKDTLAESKNILLDLENAIYQIGEHIKNIAYLISINNTKSNNSTGHVIPC